MNEKTRLKPGQKYILENGEEVTYVADTPTGVAFPDTERVVIIRHADGTEEGLPLSSLRRPN